MDGWLIAFQLPEGMPATRRVRFQHKFWGRVAKTAKGRYEHHEEGIMEGVPHRRLIRGVIVLRDEDLNRVIAFLRDWKATHHVRKVPLDRDDQKALKGSN